MSFVLADFVQSVPSPLTFALVSLADSIQGFKNVLQILSWRSQSKFDGFLLVFAWWAVCLFADSVLRFYLPPALVAITLYYRTRRQDRKQIVTEQVLASTVSDLSIIPTLLPSWPSLPAIPLRAVAILYIPYLLLTLYVPLRLIFAISGTIIFTWRAPFAVLLRTTLWRSAFIRPSHPQTQTIQTVSAAKDDAPPATSSLRFLFAIHENQRWWMGLDWTAALLPGERPSWCSPAHAPLSPPGVFSLPNPTVVYLPHPSDDSRRIKRTAEWYWEEPEWTVLVRKEGGALSRVERPVPSTADENTSGNNAAATGSRLFKAASNRFSASKDRDHKDKESGHSRDDSSSVHSIEREMEVETGRDESYEPFTDPDGWVYGDNKWENQSNKGGISKYTRFRRWTRIAVLTEFVQVVDASEETRSKSAAPTLKRTAPPLAPINVSKEGAAPPSTMVASPVPTSATASTAPGASKLGDDSDQTVVVSKQPLASPALMSPTGTGAEAHHVQSPPGSGFDSPLRQRLRNALNKS
ncbi:integral peroxisomal membrane peroxin-domain-containing protein [Ephemerocybe angulata]|uniref:Integral peroxisomal membrane peroxin-domain-containing protein n=1 Tax=Ephemerocybe angulata TaxID=980116 RepID=A0A8H6MCF7_9AGAR|nr:integral peroxisomal membrane peroxin-domain-containing protein [Tulosesus angulatus]